MKSILVLVLGAVLITFTADVLAGETEYFAKDNEPLYGTWINMDYDTRPPQKLVYNPDGTAWSSMLAKSKKPEWRIKYLIIGKWKDSNGNIMYKSHWVGDWGEEAFQLSRISNSGNTLEYMFSHDDYPKEINPEDFFYRKYTRK